MLKVLLHANDSPVHPVCDGLLESIHVYKMKFVTTMLKEGEPLNKIDFIKDLLSLDI